MPDILESKVQQMIDAGESEDAINAYIDSHDSMSPVSSSEPDTFMGGVMKALTGGDSLDAGLRGATGFIKGATVDIPQGLWSGAKGLGSLAKNAMMGPFQEQPGISNETWNSLKAAPGAMADMFMKSGSEPEAFGRTVGQITGQPAVTAGVTAALPSVASAIAPAAKLGARVGGRGLEAVGDVMANHQPISGVVPRMFDMRTARMGEHVIGRGVSKLGTKIRNMGTDIPEVPSNIIGPNFAEGQIVDEAITDPARMLGPSSGDTVNIPPNIHHPNFTSPENPWNAQGPFFNPQAKALHGEVPFEPAADISRNMNSTPDSGFMNQVMQATDNPPPQDIFNLPETIQQPPKMLGPASPASSAEARLQELMGQMESPGIQGQRFGPVDDVMNTGGANTSDEMYDLIQQMSGGRTSPRPNTAGLEGMDIDNEINKLIEDLGKIRQPSSVVNHPDLAINASGESSASMEAINRISSMTKKGENFVVYDKAGNVKPLIGPDAVDYVAKPGETYGVRGPEGFKVLDNKGGRVPPTSKAPIKHAELVVQEGNKYGPRGENYNSKYPQDSNRSPMQQYEHDSFLKSLDWEPEVGSSPVGFNPGELSDIVRDVTRRKTDVMGLTNETIAPPKIEKSVTPVKGAVETYTVPKSKMTVEIMEGSGKKGFKFIGEDKDGNYRFKKITKGEGVKKKVTTPEFSWEDSSPTERIQHLTNKIDNDGKLSVSELSKIQDQPGRVKSIQNNERIGLDIIKSDIKKNGLKEPIIVRKTPQGEISIEDGHHRLAAARELGIKEIPVKWGEKGSRSKGEK